MPISARSMGGPDGARQPRQCGDDGAAQGRGKKIGRAPTHSYLTPSLKTPRCGDEGARSLPINCYSYRHQCAFQIFVRGERRMRRGHGGMIRFKKLLLLVATLMLGGCVTVIYDPASSGYFTGQLFVMWIEEGGPSGDGIFLFVPNPRNRLTFHRNTPQGHGAIIQPGFMYTAGGSIPRIAQVFNGFSPWGYAPAYMIHDWRFTVRHCLVDGKTDPK